MRLAQSSDIIIFSLLLFTFVKDIQGSDARKPPAPGVVHQSVRVPEGGTISLACSFPNLRPVGDASVPPGSSGMSLLWFRFTKDGHDSLLAEGSNINPAINTDGTFRIFSPQEHSPFSVLVIHGAKSKHSGFFKCIPSSDDIAQQVFIVDVFKPTLKVNVSQKHLNPKSVVKLSCDVTKKDPEPLVYWTKEKGTGLKKSWEFKAWGEELIVNDSAVYLCHVDNLLTTPFLASFNTTPVQKAEKLTLVKAEAIRDKDGFTKELHCFIKGPDDMKIQWHFYYNLKRRELPMYKICPSCSAEVTQKNNIKYAILKLEKFKPIWQRTYVKCSVTSDNLETAMRTFLITDKVVDRKTFPSHPKFPSDDEDLSSNELGSGSGQGPLMSQQYRKDRALRILEIRKRYENIKRFIGKHH